MPHAALNRRSLFAVGSAGLTASALPLSRAFAADAAAVRFDPAFIDAEAERMRHAFDAPGFGVAIVGAGPEPWVKGYGVRTMGRPELVDAHTRFAIASNSKAYTSAAMSILVDEGKVGWDDPVVKHLPEFKMYDPAVTQMMSVRDLLCHRSGLALGAGDLLFFPDTTHTAEDAIHALQFLKPARPFRGGYAYDNILYTVAGVLIARVAGMSWSDFVASRLLKPIGEVDAVPNLDSLHTDNVAGRHGERKGSMMGIGTMQIVKPLGEHNPAIAPAGGINASATDQARWLMTQLAKGKAPDGARIWSEKQADEMWKPQVIVGMSDGPSPEDPSRSVLSAYALGWFISDYRGERLVAHSGGLLGQVTQTAMIPRRGIGVVVFSNCEGAGSTMLRNAILDHLLGAPKTDWAALGKARVAAMQAQLMAASDHAVDKQPPGGPSLPIDAYVGRYRDNWYGDVVVRREGGGLAIDFVSTPVWKSVLEPWGPDSFRTHFPKDSGEDALVSFVVKDGKVVQVLMKPFSPLADFSFDFQHLDFKPVG
ncbi:MAG TPA: serine hydrolase [Caulobacteraceae bacterium]|jgi:CubicO group peptidase (beta-lactamase class C family)|nr:serine hydrolase [Caulobacteraceae bacterium]